MSENCFSQPIHDQNDKSMINDSVRQTVWDYVSAKHHKLIDIAAEIAMGNDRIEEASKANLLEDGDLDGDSPTARRAEERLLSDCYDQNCPNGKCGVCGSARCPKPINYLANGDNIARLETSPLFKEDIRGIMSAPPRGLVWRPPGRPRVFSGCNFDVLDQLADAKASPNLLPTKTCEQLRGFNTQGKKGLSILFSPWTDFCLWCWALYDAVASRDEARQHLKPIFVLGKDYFPLSWDYISGNEDWGVSRTLDILIRQNSDTSTTNLFGSINQLAAGFGMTLVEFIGWKRIFVYNVWPWFRCGQDTSGNSGVHSNIAGVPGIVHWLHELRGALTPRKIATLGDWAYKNKPSNTWFIGAFLLSPPPAPQVVHFYHLSSPGWPAESVLFREFISC